MGERYHLSLRKRNGGKLADAENLGNDNSPQLLNRILSNRHSDSHTTINIYCNNFRAHSIFNHHLVGSAGLKTLEPAHIDSSVIASLVIQPIKPRNNFFDFMSILGNYCILQEPYPIDSGVTSERTPFSSHPRVLIIILTLTKRVSRACIYLGHSYAKCSG